MPERCSWGHDHRHRAVQAYGWRGTLAAAQGTDVPPRAVRFGCARRGTDLTTDRQVLRESGQWPLADWSARLAQ